MLQSLGVRACIALTSLVSSAHGNNNLFLPGDAFFPTVLTAHSLAGLNAHNGAIPTFDYHPMGGYDAAYCGYAGYQRAAIKGVDAAFIENLRLAYARIQGAEKRLIKSSDDGQVELVETRGMRVLFYPQGFTFPRYKLGLRYNERWVEEVAKFGHLREHMRLCCLVDHDDAVTESWRDAEIVPPLHAALPDVELKSVPPTIEPVTIGEPVKAFVLHTWSLTRYFRPKNDDGMTLVVVDSAGVEELRYQEGSWIAGAQEKAARKE